MSGPVRMILIAVLGIAGLYVLAMILLSIFQGAFLFSPFLREVKARPVDVGLSYEEITITTEDGIALSAWFIPAEGTETTVLFFHGNAGNMSHRLDSIRIFHDLGLDVLIIDYRGYGASYGRPTEKGLYLDAEAAWRYLVEIRAADPAKIIIFGRSLGGAVAARQAQQTRPRMLILESTFTGVKDLAQEMFPIFPVRLMGRIHFSTIDRLPDFDFPVLIIHSPDDDLIPFSHGKRLFEAAGEPKAFLAITGGHRDGYLQSGSIYTQGLAAFLTSH